MAESKWIGIYEYKGFLIWSPSETGWIAEPDWCEQAIENYKYKAKKEFKTIVAAKKWVDKEGIHLKESDFT